MPIKQVAELSFDAPPPDPPALPLFSDLTAPRPPPVDVIAEGCEKVELPPFPGAPDPPPPPTTKYRKPVPVDASAGGLLTTKVPFDVKV